MEVAEICNNTLAYSGLDKITGFTALYPKAYLKKDILCHN
jgi:hypothetical protein